MAVVRAVTMQARMRRRAPVGGRPWAARKVERRAKGRAKIVWEILMSAAKRESFWGREEGGRVVWVLGLRGSISGAGRPRDGGKRGRDARVTAWGGRVLDRRGG
jgi:hypothetical protein